MIIQAPVVFARRSRCLSVPLISLNKLLSLDLYVTSWSFFPSRRSSLRVWRWSALENPPPTVTDRTSSALPCRELKYFSCADVTGFRISSPAFFTGIILRDPTTGDRIFVFPKKRRGKKVLQIIFSTPANASPVSLVTR